MNKKELPDQDLLHELLEYNPETGALTWRPRHPGKFKETGGRRSIESVCATWNARYAGRTAGRRRRYVMVKVQGVDYAAHRLIWKMETGEDPEEIDHINRSKLDNRIANLRNVSRSVNQRNVGVRPGTRSGHKHVTFLPRQRLWAVQLTVPGKGQRQVAFSKSLAEAVTMRNTLLPRYGYNIETDAA